jgi:hypothetical protein
MSAHSPGALDVHFCDFERFHQHPLFYHVAGGKTGERCCPIKLTDFPFLLAPCHQPLGIPESVKSAFDLDWTPFAATARSGDTSCVEAGRNRGERICTIGLDLCERRS